MFFQSYLAYHLDVCDYTNVLPPTWSSSYLSIPELICKRIFLIHYYSSFFNEFSSDSVAEEGVIAYVDGYLSGYGFEDFQTQSKSLYEAIYVLNEYSESYKKEYVSNLLSFMELLTSISRADIDSLELKNLLQSQYEDFMAKKHSKKPNRKLWGGNKNIWIVKPVGQSNGRNIIVGKGVKEVFCAVDNLKFKAVVQKYIEHPLLLYPFKKKFDIRQWVLITSVNPLVIYGFSECYCRLSSKSFQLDATDLNDPFIHLCNHSIQKKYYEKENEEGGDAYAEGKEEGTEGSTENIPAEHSRKDPKEELMWSQQELEEYLLVNSSVPITSPFETIILPQMKHCAISAISSARDRLDQTCGRGKGFEWLGLDFMIAVNCKDSPPLSPLPSVQPSFDPSDLEVCLLEVNISPDTTSSTAITSRLVTAATHHLFEIVLKDDRKLSSINSSNEDCSRVIYESQWDLWFHESHRDLNVQSVTVSKTNKCKLRMRADEVKATEEGDVTRRCGDEMEPAFVARCKDLWCI